MLPCCLDVKRLSEEAPFLPQTPLDPRIRPARFSWPKDTITPTWTEAEAAKAAHWPESRMGLPEQLQQVLVGLRAEWGAQPTLLSKIRRVLAVLRVVLVRFRAGE